MILIPTEPTCHIESRSLDKLSSCIKISCKKQTKTFRLYPEAVNTFVRDNFNPLLCIKFSALLFLCMQFLRCSISFMPNTICIHFVYNTRVIVSRQC